MREIKSYNKSVEKYIGDGIKSGEARAAERKKERKSRCNKMAFILTWIQSNLSPHSIWNFWYQNPLQWSDLGTNGCDILVK